MTTPFSLQRFLCVLVLGLTAVMNSAYAEKADRDKPTNVEADRLTVDDLKQVSVFSGNVVLTKGTLMIRADQLTLREDPQGYQYATATAQNGKLVFFRQKREGLDQYIEGIAERMEYDGKTEKIKLITRAVMKRLEGASAADEVRGNVIDYDSRTEFFTVLGDSGSSATKENRVRAILQPKKTSTATPLPNTNASPATLGLKVTPSIQTPRDE